MIDSGEYCIILFNQLITLNVDVVPEDYWGKAALAWEILEVRDGSTNRVCSNGRLLSKIEEHIYDVGLLQLLDNCIV